MQSSPKKLKKFAVAALATLAFSTTISAAEQQDTWGKYSILTDTSSIDVKLQRFEKNSVYKAAAVKQASDDTDAGYTSQLSKGKFDERYLIFWSLFTNPELTTDQAIAFGGMHKVDLTSPYLNHNISYVEQCRKTIDTKLTGTPKSILKINEIRVCAQNKIKENYTLFMNNVELDPAPVTQKISKFDAPVEEDIKQQYSKAVKASSENYDFGIIGYTNYIRLWDATLDPLASWENLKDVPHNNANLQAKGVKQFSYETPKNTAVDKNLRYLFECRDTFLPSQLGDDYRARKQAFDTIQNCWSSRTKQANIEYKIEQKHMMVSSEGLEANLRKYNAWTQQKMPAFKVYWQRTANSMSEFKQRYPLGTNHIQALILWDAMLNPEITIDNFKNRGGFALQTISTPNLDQNMAPLFDCKAQFTTDDSLKTASQRLATIYKIADCWQEQTNAPYQKYQDDLKIVQGNAKNILFDARPLDEKIANYTAWSTDKNPVYKPYFDAVTQRAKGWRDVGIAQGSNLDMIRLWHSFIDTNYSYQDMENDVKITKSNRKSKSVTQNMSSVFKCRAEILKQIPLENVANPEQSYRDVYNCASEQFRGNYTQYQKEMSTLKSENIYGADEPDSLVELVERMQTDLRLTPKIILNSGLTPLNPDSMKLRDNVQYIIECRKNALDQGISPTDTKNKFYQNVHSCAVNKVTTAYKAENLKENTLMGIFGSLLFLGGVGYLTAPAIRKKIQSRPKLKNN